MHEGLLEQELPHQQQLQPGVSQRSWVRRAAVVTLLSAAKQYGWQ